MKNRRLWLIGGVVLAAAAAFLVAYPAQAQLSAEQGLESEFGLQQLVPQVEPEMPVPLEVSVPPHAIGGYGNLLVTAGGNTAHLMSFQIEEPLFIVEAPAFPPDPELFSTGFAFSYEAFGPDGEFLGVSNKTKDPLEPEFD